MSEPMFFIENNSMDFKKSAEFKLQSPIQQYIQKSQDQNPLIDEYQQSNNHEQIQIDDSDSAIKKPESPIKEESIYFQIGGEQSIIKIQEIFNSKLDSDDFQQSIKQLQGKILEKQQNKSSILSFLQILTLIIKGKHNKIDKDKLKQEFQQIKVSEDDFQQVITLLRKVIISSKLIKLPALKDIISQYSQLRDLIVYDESYIIQQQLNDQSLYYRLGQIKGIEGIIDNFFNILSAQQDLSQFYQKKNLDMIKKKYAYFISGQIGGRYDWLGLPIDQVHQKYNKENQSQEIQCPHFQQWIELFKQALSEKNVNQQEQNEFLQILQNFQSQIIIKSDEDQGLSTLEECRKSDLFIQMISDLRQKIKEKIREEDISAQELKSMKEYLEDEDKFKNLEDRVACLISNKTQEDFGITDQELQDTWNGEGDNIVDPGLFKIAECIGELFEELDFDCDTVDQVKQLFIVIDLNRLIEKKENNNKQSNSLIKVPSNTKSESSEQNKQINKKKIDSCRKMLSML